MEDIIIIGFYVVPPFLSDESDEDGEEEESGTEDESKDLPEKAATEKLKELEIKESK